MKQFMFSLLFLIAGLPVLAQSSVKGKVIDAITTEALPDVELSIQGGNRSVRTDGNGMFMLDNVELGDQILVVVKNGFITKRLPIILQEGQVLNIETILMDVDVSAEQQQIGLISLSDNEISGDDDDSGSFNVSGLLTASRDVFLNAAAFDFSATFFRPRGLDNANGKVLINGMEMNKQFNGRPQWGNWGGLNDVQRNREFSMGLTPSEYSFGGLAGTTNIIMRASQDRQGGRISYASGNRSYNGRVMASYSSGLMASGWAYTFLASRRFGKEGLLDHMERGVRLSKHVESLINSSDGVFELAVPRSLSLVCFRWNGGDQKRLLDAVKKTGKCFIIHTKLDGKMVLRFACGGIEQTKEDVTKAFEVITSVAKALSKSE